MHAPLSEAHPTDADLAAMVIRALVEVLPERVPEPHPFAAHDFEYLTRRLRPYYEAGFLAWEAVRLAALGSPRFDVPSTWLEDWLAHRPRSEVLAMLLRAAEAVEDKPQGPHAPLSEREALPYLGITLPGRFPALSPYALEELAWVLHEAGVPRGLARSTFSLLARHLRGRRLAEEVTAWLATTCREAVLEELGRAAT